ncbi:MAG: DNA modification methylase, partial [Phycisphaerales bacterium]|nr:DNA modification methylase [Phycisphaerales bacterium]
MTSKSPNGAPSPALESQGRGALRLESRPLSSLQVERRALSSLQVDPHNARCHDDANLEAIRASLERFGQQKPIVVTADGRVVAGNGTLEAARALGWATIDVVVTDLDGLAAKAYAIADNRSSEMGEWDQDALDATLAELAATDTDLVVAAGFDLDDFGGGESSELDAEPKIEIADELAERWGTKLGQLWQLGEHRLACGDSTDGAAVAALLRGDRPDIMVTDPPYGVEYDAAWRNEAGIAATKQTGRVHNDDRASWAAAFRHFTGDVAYVWHAGRFATAVERSLVVLGFEIRAQIVWVKRRFAISRGHYHWRHEPCWYAVRRGASARWAGGRKQSTAWADIVDAFPQPDLFACPVDEA